MEQLDDFTLAIRLLDALTTAGTTTVNLEGASPFPGPELPPGRHRQQAKVHAAKLGLVVRFVARHRTKLAADPSLYLRCQLAGPVLQLDVVQP